MTPDELKAELYKTRVDIYDRRAESLRSLEWSLFYQLYGGYAAIGLAYYQLNKDAAGHSWLLGASGILLVVLLFTGNAFLAARIQERQNRAQILQARYFQALHDLAGAPLLEASLDLPAAQYPRDWAYWVQTILTVATTIAFVGYIARHSPLVP